MAVNIEFKHQSKRVAVTPGMTLFQVVDACRTHFGLDASEQYELTHRGNVIDLSIPFRLTGVSNNASLELRVAATTTTGGGGDSNNNAQQVRVAVQSLDGKRVQQSFASDTTIEQMLTVCKQLPLAVDGQPFSLTYMQREILFDAFASTTLKNLGLVSGSAMFRMQRSSSSSVATTAPVERAPASTAPTVAPPRSVSFAAPPTAPVDMEVEDEETKQSEPPSTTRQPQQSASSVVSPPSTLPASSRDTDVEMSAADDHQPPPAATPAPAASVMSSYDALQLLRDSCFDTVSRVAITTLLKIVTNILSYPENDKMRAIRVTNAAFHRNVGQHQGGLEFLTSLGFTLDQETQTLALLVPSKPLLTKAVKLLNVEADDLGIAASELPQVVQPVVVTQEFDAFKSVITRMQAQPRGPSATEVQVDTLKAKQDALMQQIVKPPRNTTVQFPGQAMAASSMTATSDHDDDGVPVENTRSDASLVIASMKARRVEMEKAQNFRTQAMRDLDELKRKKVFQQALLRVQFPDRVILQAAFHPTETIADVMAHIHDCLATTHATASSFYLYVSPPLQKLAPEKTLADLGLVPAAHTYLSWITPPASPISETAATATAPTLSGWYLRQDLVTPDHAEAKQTKGTTSSSSAMAAAYPNSIALDESAAKAAQAAAASAALKRTAAGESKITTAKSSGKKPAWFKL